MKLLILTQKIDIDDDLLGFFHGWVAEFAKHYEKITVVALGVGEYSLPVNVKVLSLGKEQGGSKIKYAINFYGYILRERRNYDAVFVHMNKEYVLMGGILWKLLGKKIYLWYNHRHGDLLSDASGYFSDKVFYTSPFSYFSKNKKSESMPVGVDTEVFARDGRTERIGNSILCLGRISPVKNIEVLIKAAKILKDQNQEFIIDIVGATTDYPYYEKLKKMVKDYDLAAEINFLESIPNREAPSEYNRHEIYINLTNSGSLDKTIFEAMACGSLILVSNRSLAGQVDDLFIFKEGDVQGAADCIKKIFSLKQEVRNEFGKELRQFVENYHSLNRLANELARKMR